MRRLTIRIHILQVGRTLLVNGIAVHFGDPYISLGVARGNPGAKVVELCIILSKQIRTLEMSESRENKVQLTITPSWLVSTTAIVSLLVFVPM